MPSDALAPRRAIFVSPFLVLTTSFSFLHLSPLQAYAKRSSEGALSWIASRTVAGDIGSGIDKDDLVTHDADNFLTMDKCINDASQHPNKFIDLDLLILESARSNPSPLGHAIIQSTIFVVFGVISLRESYFSLIACRSL